VPAMNFLEQENADEPAAHSGVHGPQDVSSKVLTKPAKLQCGEEATMKRFRTGVRHFTDPDAPGLTINNTIAPSEFQ
jgi:hypothetical protein